MIKVSIIIPSYNAENTIRRTLKALVNQKFSKININYEILVVNDGSTDNTENIIKEYIKKYKDIRLINQKNQGPAAARNTGAKQAKGEIIFFTDADCEPMENWIEEMIKPFFEDKSVGGVKGAYRTKQKSIVAQFVQYEYEFKYKKMMRYKEIDFIDTYSAGFRKDIFIQHKGYNTNFPVACAEDVELSFRMKKSGVKMVFNPNAIVYHIHPTSLKSYFFKKLKFAYWRIAAVSLHPDFAINDSHTPQFMKFQLIFAPLLVLSIFFKFIFKNQLFSYGLYTIVLAYSTTILPFWSFLVRRKKVFIIFAPLFIFTRNIAQIIGIAMRFYHNFLKKNLVVSS